MSIIPSAPEIPDLLPYHLAGVRIGQGHAPTPCLRSQSLSTYFSWYTPRECPICMGGNDPRTPESGGMVPGVWFPRPCSRAASFCKRGVADAHSRPSCSGCDTRTNRSPALPIHTRRHERTPTRLWRRYHGWSRMQDSKNQVGLSSLWCVRSVHYEMPSRLSRRPIKESDFATRIACDAKLCYSQIKENNILWE